ncbi:Endonuclease/exonuclease/phosphatase [Artemisia annua]|uniref:Endonuclease/exonuclease/phosphatase n=1 Tax=Artemisia annua TaxID=35608 RepID=A0A2U1KNY1_ARTAN|nr:Endonuclease/exonuclease/phosphatase [Artemisia annua]
MVKIISLNVSGLGTDDKVNWVKEIGEGEKPCVVGLQETKLKEVDETFVKRMWYENNFGFAQLNSDGRSGGIMTIWDSNIFEGTHAAGEDGFLAVVGKWKGVEGLVGLLNIYGPRDEYQRLQLWNKLGNLLGMRDVMWCIFGDFNENAVETTDHIMVRCSYASAVWSKICLWWNIGRFNGSSLSDILSSYGLVSSKLESVWQAVIWSSFYLIWKARNSKVFRSKEMVVADMFFEIQFEFMAGL